MNEATTDGHDDVGIAIIGRVLPRCHWKKSMRRFAGLKLEQVS
jgi:hypothetical protein